MRIRLIWFLCTLLLLLLNVGAINAQQRSIAITIDDLPYVGSPNSLEAAKQTTDHILTSLEKFDVPASGFVTGSRVMVSNEIDARMNLLRQWRDAGAKLENHGYAHLPYHNTSIQVYLDDIMRGELFPEIIMSEQEDSVRFFRSPFNSTGETSEKKSRLLEFLAERNIILAPFTIEHADYLFNSLYQDALKQQDTVAANQISQAYLAQLDSALTFAEKLSRETFGREIPQILLIHANRINADYLGQMLEFLKQRGYHFVSLEEAIKDPAYQSPDNYTERWGISWLHRWRESLGLENRLRNEPDLPEWIYDSYKKLNNQ